MFRLHRFGTALVAALTLSAPAFAQGQAAQGGEGVDLGVERHVALEVGVRVVVRPGPVPRDELDDRRVLSRHGRRT